MRKVHGAVAAVVSEPSEAAWLERHLRPLVGIDTDDLGSGDRRGEAFTAWRRLLEALAEEEPLVLVFDDPEGANAVYTRLQPFGRLNATLPPELCRGSVSRGLGILAATMGRWSEAEERFEVALRMNAEMAARPWLGHTQYDYARALLRRGEPGDHGQ
jgi:tetratricopeptide (TPR) repeat protein